MGDKDNISGIFFPDIKGIGIYDFPTGYFKGIMTQPMNIVYHM
jgi:hypothetical protein